MVSNAFSKVVIVLFHAGLAFSAGTQFITGPCNSDADCASSCCGFNSGLCAGPVIAQTRDGGCGHGDAQPNDIAAQAFFSSQSAGAAAATVPAAAATTAAAQAATTAASGSGAINSALPGAENVGKGDASQFITGQCFSDADCASGCCAFNTGLCAGAVIAQTRDGGCGFGSGTPNDNAAQALTGGGAQATSPANAAPATPTSGSTTSSSSSSGTSSSDGTINSSIPGSENVGKGDASQFITGQCFSDADCASGCCGFNSGLCAGAVIAQTRDGGCGFGDAQPNDNAAQALTGSAKKRGTIVKEYMA